MSKLFEIDVNGDIHPGIQLNKQLPEVILGKSFLNDPAIVVKVSAEVPVDDGCISEADFEDGWFYPQEYETSGIIVLVRNQVKAAGSWDIYHPNDPFCEGEHNPGKLCEECTDSGKVHWKNCGHFCPDCGGKRRFYPRRVHVFDVPILCKHYVCKPTSRKKGRQGMEALLAIEPGESWIFARYTMDWFVSGRHRLVEYSPEGYLRMSHFSDTDPKPQKVWL